MQLGLVLGVACVGVSCGEAPDGSWTTARPIHGFRVVASYPHDPQAFTQGLAIHMGQLYEGTGSYGKSVVRRVDLTTGRSLRETQLAPEFFGEGITLWDDKLIQLTWRNHQGFIYARETFAREHSFTLAWEGWGLTHDGRQWIASDGTEVLRFLDPQTQRVVRRLRVMDEDRPLRYLNELEYIDGQVWANIWHNDLIARIDPESGQVVSYVDLSGLYPEQHSRKHEQVLNGIAYDADANRLFVTGKNWPRLYEIQVLEGQQN
ncbi:glutaminyl-peptide cyclotransferase [Thiorhodococcus mannitoliphagus]|uniref:Glutaminyl-peptide cyclotransferase n=1 Tax=Thiorhodococcus mannitoliphagus TaxID=329406 RepID=A0A6P1DWN5_9GAMM|nr:glutaminyl-peptide cyclotransferase [Thiorhodococcus mannitoliphagus]